LDAIPAKLEKYVAIWNPQVFLNSSEIKPKSQDPVLLKIDPINENYHNNTLEWDYGICKRWLRVIEGMVLEYYIFDQNPNGSIVIKSNTKGDLKAAGYYAVDNEGNGLKGFEVVGDEKRIPAKAFENAVYPITVDDTYTGYSTSSDGDIYARDFSYSTAHNSATGTISDTGTYFSIGQEYNSRSNPPYRIDRGFVFFDTSSIPSSATISDATLSLYGYRDRSVTDFDITIPA